MFSILKLLRQSVSPMWCDDYDKKELTSFQGWKNPNAKMHALLLVSFAKEP